MTFLRIIALVGLSYVLSLGFSESWETAFYALLVLGVCLWVAATLVELWQHVRSALSRPNVNVYVHPDPTRPDDEHPLIVINEQNRRRR